MALKLDEMERNVLDFWAKNHIFEQSVENRKGCKPFVIYEGPPTANGKPGIHHVLTRTFKDLIARFQTMRGRYVERKAGWDEHGLPVEIESQKELGLHTKKQIEEYGVQKFNDHCAKSTQKYIGDWEALTQRMGYWLDFKNAYRTSDPDYIKKVWMILRHLFENDLIYQAQKVVPWACDSGNVMSNHEVAQGYKTVKHLSANVLFKLADDKTYLMAWTTTPWTLPGNMALAVNPKLTYNVCRVNGKTVISLKKVGEVVGEVYGEVLVGQEYYHPFTNKTCPVLAADFVKAEATGIVHIAPAFGQDDYELWKKLGKTINCHINENGKFLSPEWMKGHNVLANNFKDANMQIIEFLKANEALFDYAEYEHEYPHNWRTGKPLIYYLRPSWYVNVNKFRAKMIEANEHVTWYPDNVKHGRFGGWLQGDVDWSISRERFWGTPLPFYGDKVIYPNHPHKPEADESFGTLQRTPEVLDCWFDSGAVPFAAYNSYQQADVICEAVDQTRGWFYSLMALGVALKGEAPYKRVVCLGHILDKDGHKMAKSKGNVIDPWKMFEKYGADAVRWYMASNPIGNSLIFSEDGLRSVVQNFINRLWNSFSFLKMYADIEGPQCLDKFMWNNNPAPALQPIDQWILARLNTTVNFSTVCYDCYRFSEMTAEVEKFVDDLSNVWIRANRNRFWNIENNQVDDAAFYTLYKCLTTLCQVIAPIMPFLSEHMWRELATGSVHLTDWPKGRNTTLEEEELLKAMAGALEIVSVGHKCRDKAGIKVRQALQAIYIPKHPSIPIWHTFICDELNVKEVIPCKDLEEIALETTLNENLISEGLARDFVRAVQVLRKEAGLQVTDRIKLTVDYRSNDKLMERLQKHQENSMKKLLVIELKQDAVQCNIKMGDNVIGIEIVKVS